MQLAIRILRILVTQLVALQKTEPVINNIAGVELLNEPHPASHEALYHWYKEAIQEIRSLDPSFPIYLSDCWMTDQYTDFVANLPPTSALTCVDHHLYRCFTRNDISTPVMQHIASLSDPNTFFPQMFSRASDKLATAGSALIVGEWSAALNPGSLKGVADEHRVRASYVQAQLSLFELYCAGSFFWTYKKERRGDQGWSFREAVESGIFPNTVGMIPVKDFVGLSADISTRKLAARNVATGKSESYDYAVTALSLLLCIKVSTHLTGRNFPAIMSIGALVPASIRAGRKLTTSSPWTARVIPPSRNLDSKAALQRGKHRNTFE